MAPKRVKEDPPPASSSEEEDSSGEETESSDNEPELSQPPQTQSKKPELQKPEEEESESGEEDESGSESEDGSDSKSNAVGLHAKPSPAKSPKPKAKAAPATPVSKPTAAGKRAGGEAESSKSVKRRKEGASGENTDGTKKHMFQRIFSDNDEIVMLGGMIEFSEKRGLDPIKHLTAFHDFIQKSLSVEVTLNQVKDKIARLRKKFSRAKEGDDKSFSNVHDRDVFDLSKKIWGSKLPAEHSSRKSKVVTNGDKEDKMEIENHEPKGDHSLDWTACHIEDMEKFLAKKGLDYVEGSKRRELEKRWKEVNIASMKLLAEKSQLVSDHANWMLNAMED